MNLKKLIRRQFHRLGAEISEIPKFFNNDLFLYEQNYCQDSIKNKLFYNVGAGSFRHPFWTNVDNYSTYYSSILKKNIGVNWDLMSLKPVEISSDSAEIVFTSHTVEHITDEAAVYFFKEAYRILRPGGFFRLTMPNIDLDYNAYQKGDRSYFYWTERYTKEKYYREAKYNSPLNTASIEQIFLFHLASSLSTLHSDGAEERITNEDFRKIITGMDKEDAFNHITRKCPLEIQKKYPGNHINWWNPPKTFRILEKAGFKNFYVSGYGQSLCPVLRNIIHFDNTHPRISLFIEAVK